MKNAPQTILLGPMFDREPPSDKVAEAALLGAMALDNEVTADCLASGLSENWFTLEQHRAACLLVSGRPLAGNPYIREFWRHIIRADGGASSEQQGEAQAKRRPQRPTHAAELHSLFLLLGTFETSM